MENKQEILDLLLPALQATRNLHNLISLTYDTEKEVVIACFVCIVLGHIRMNTKKSLYRLIGSVYDSCP